MKSGLLDLSYQISLFPQACVLGKVEMLIDIVHHQSTSRVKDKPGSSMWKRVDSPKYIMPPCDVP